MRWSLVGVGALGITLFGSGCVPECGLVILLEDGDCPSVERTITTPGTCTPAEVLDLTGVPGSLAEGGTTCMCEWTNTETAQYQIGRVDVTASGARAGQAGAATPWHPTVNTRTPGSGPFRSIHPALDSGGLVDVAGAYTYYLRPIVNADDTLQPCSTFGTISWDFQVESGPTSDSSTNKIMPSGLLEDETTCTAGAQESSTFRLDRLLGVPSLVPIALEPSNHGGSHLTAITVEDFGGFDQVFIDTPTGEVELNALQHSASFAAGSVGFGSAGFRVAGGALDAVQPVVRADTHCEASSQPAVEVAQAYVLDSAQLPELAEGRLLARVDLSQGQPLLELSVEGFSHRTVAPVVEEAPNRYRLDHVTGPLELHGFVEVVGDQLVVDLEQTSLGSVSGGGFQIIAPAYGQ